MTLNKAIEHGKEKRKQYYNIAKLVSSHCRNHGGCLWCEGNRLNKDIQNKKNTDKEIKEWKKQ